MRKAGTFVVNGEKCEGCPLQKIGTGFSQIEIGSRYETTRLVLIGEASGEAEAREGLPFRPYAQSGSLLQSALKETGVSRTESAVTNVIRCRPPKDWLEGAPYQAGAIAHCVANYLIPAIESLKPRAILALGGTAQRVLTAAGRGKAFQLEYARGYAWPGAGAAEGIPVVPTFHPAFIRRGAAHLTPLLHRDLRRAWLIATGRLVEGRQFSLDPLGMGLKYQTIPTLTEAWAFADAVDPALPLAFDIETPYSTRSDEDERTSFTDRDIKLVQFSQSRGTGIALPFRDEYREVVRAVLDRASIRVGFNNWNFDDPVLKGNGIDVGDTFDAMTMFHFYHPDLPANLQAAAQFCGFPFPWKHFSGSDLEWYGIADVDATLCVFETMKGLLEREGMWDSYERYFKRVWPIFRAMAQRGLPIDDTARLALKETIRREDERASAAIREMVPRDALGNEKPLKRVPKDLTGFQEVEVVIEKEERCQCLKKNRGECALCVGTGTIAAGTCLTRWGKVKEFNPNSSHQVKAFMKYLKHPVPKHAKRTDAQGDAAETTEVKELERLFVKTRHPLYPLLIEKRQLSKIEGTYVEGWTPSKDGKVHTTFTFKPATWQTSSRAPNIQNGLKHGKTNFQKNLAKAFNGMQNAEPGFVIVNVDAKSFHAQTTACEAGLADYLRLAKIDIHSFVTCHYLRLPERVGLYERPDQEMAEIFKRLKKDEKFKFTRDYKAKRTILGIQFAMGPAKLYKLNPDDFENQAEAKALHDLIMVQLFPGLGKMHRDVKAEAAENGFLVNRFGAIRRFYDVQRFSHQQMKMIAGDQAEQAIAFRPASNAFGYMREIMLRMRERGLDERYQLVNSIHDSLVFHCPIALAEECMANITAEVRVPCAKLAYAGVTGPEGLSVDAEASWGPDLANMVEWKG